MTETDERFAALLDDRGVLRAAGALAAPDPAYRVFGQRPDARCEIGAWRHNAERFFGTTVGLTVDKRYAGSYPDVDAARVVVAPTSGDVGGVRLCYGRRAAGADWDAAERADARAGTTGLGELARRCHVVWLVERQGPEDPTALLLAAIIASVLLGPILDVAGASAENAGELFGVRTARLKLEGGSAPYR